MELCGAVFETCPTHLQDTRLVLKNLLYIRVSCSFQCHRVRATYMLLGGKILVRIAMHLGLLLIGSLFMRSIIY